MKIVKKLLKVNALLDVHIEDLHALDRAISVTDATVKHVAKSNLVDDRVRMEIEIARWEVGKLRQALAESKYDVSVSIC